jgi:hypothetical protein
LCTNSVRLTPDARSAEAQRGMIREADGAPLLVY